MSSPLHVTPPSTSTGLARNLNAFVRYSSTAARAVNRALIQYTLRRHYSMIPTDRFFPSHRLRISGYAGIEYPLHILQRYVRILGCLPLASIAPDTTRFPALPRAQIPRRACTVDIALHDNSGEDDRWLVHHLWPVLLAVCTALPTFYEQDSRSAPASTPSSRIQHGLALRSQAYDLPACLDGAPDFPRLLLRSRVPLPRLHRHVRHECVPPAARAALLLNNAINAEGITSSQMFPFALYLLCTPRCCRARAYTTPSALALAFAARRLSGLLEESRCSGDERRASATSSHSLPWERPAMVPSPSSDWMGCKSVALMEWEEGVQWRGRWASLIVGPMLAHSFSHDLTVRRQAIFDPIFARFRYRFAR
ncbi:hypothetical protein B0H13DRAFT_2353484 [Mycena leptocephala]|nr:hypothetical protein B0H13DRAFT_2353484 [Mycena leptocephala]